MNHSQKTLVSIAVLTYNHQNYIEQALDSFLMQKTEFDFEIIVGDDASTDNTSSILMSYKERFPKLFNLNLHSKNIGMMPNFISTLKSCKGKYIAFCEGDDYWTDIKKLQKQIDFLEKNEDYAICFHDCKIFNQANNKLEEDNITKSEKDIYTKSDLVTGNFMQTPSIVIRNNFTIPDWFKKSPIGDWPLYLHLIDDFKIKKINEVMAVYRVHQESVWSSKTDLYRLKKTVKVINIVLKNIKFNTLDKEKLNSTKRGLKRSIRKIKWSWFRSLKK